VVRHHQAVFWKKRKTEVEEQTLVNALAFMMGMDAKLDEILAILRDEDDVGPES
jgi:hypothetical protein